jgi:hypothetical protein
LKFLNELAASNDRNFKFTALVLAHLSFIEDLDDSLEIDGRLVGQLIEPLRHSDQGGSRACVRGDASYSKTVGRGQAEFFGSIRHVRTLTLRKLRKIELVPAYANCALGSCPYQLYELIGDKAGFEQLQSRLRNVHFGLTVETSAIGPVDPRPPQSGQRAAKAGAWSRVLQASYVRSRRKLTCELRAAIRNYFRRAACCAHAAAGRGFGWSASS